MGSVDEHKTVPVPGCRPILCPFSVSDYKLHSANVDSDQPLRITTSPDRWSYAVAFPIQDEARDVSSCVLIRITATVEIGCIGFGILDENETDFLVEIQQSPDHDVHHVDLLCEAIPTRAWIMIRNCADNGAVSQVSINDIEAFSVQVDLPADQELRSPPRNSLRPVIQWSQYYGNSFSDVGDSIRAMQYESLSATQPMLWLQGLRIQIHPNHEMSRVAFISGLYEPNLLITLQHLLNPGDTFLDIGANIGFIALFASRCVGPTGTVHAFEPSKREFERLCQNINLNRLKNIRAVQSAVNDQVGVAQLSVADEYHGGHNTLAATFGYQTIAKLRTERVQTTTVDAYVASEGLNNISVIKIDVEGGEHHVLASAHQTIQQFRPVLILEASPRHLEQHGRSLTDLRSQLQDYGYSIWDIGASDAKLERLSNSAVTLPENIVAVPREAESRIPQIAQSTGYDQNQSIPA